MHLYFKINRKLATRLGSENCPSLQYILPFIYCAPIILSGFAFSSMLQKPIYLSLLHLLPSRNSLLTPCFLTLEIQLSIFSCFEFLIQVLAI